MEKDKKGLADTQDGEFILNESGTAVSTDSVEGVDIPEPGEGKLEERDNVGAEQQAGKEKDSR